MANEIFTRIQLKYDSYKNWVDNNPTLLSGEVAIAKLVNDVTIPVDEQKNAPVLFKVGPGAFNDLPWVSGLAADVYAWAKAKDVRLKDQKLEFFTTTDNGDVIAKTVDLTTFATEAEVEALLAGYKKVQTAVTDPTANGKSLTFIDTISQDTQGVITATKKNVNLDDYALKADLGDVATLKTTAETAVGAINEHDTEIGDLTKLSTSNKGDLVTAINEVRQAVEVGGTGSVVTVRKDGDNTYHVQQGGKDVAVAIELGNGEFTVSGDDGLEGSGSMTANQAGNTSATIKHAAAGSVTTNSKETDVKVVTGISRDKFGHVVSDTREEVTVTAGNKGVAGWGAGYAPTIITKIGEQECGDGLPVVGKDGISVSVHTFTEGGANQTGLQIDGSELLQDAKDYTDTEIAKAHASVVDYRGVANALTDLAQDAGKGDFYRVGTEIKSGDTILAYAGDLVVAEKDKPAQQIDGTNWTAIHSGDGDISNVIAGNGLTGGGSTGEVTVSHGPKPSAGSEHANTQDGTTRKYVTGIDVDEFGHIAAVHTQEEQSDIQDLSGYKTKQTAVTDKITDAAHVLDSLTQNENGEISYTVKKMTPADIGAQKKSVFVDQLPTTGEEDTIYYVTNKVKYEIKEGYSINTDRYLLGDPDYTTILVEAEFGYSVIVPHGDSYQTGTIFWYAGDLNSAINYQWNEYEEEGRYIYPTGTYIPSVASTASTIITYAVTVSRNAIQSYTTAPHYAAEGCYGYTYKDEKWECIFVPFGQEDINHVRIGLSEFKEEAQEQIDNINRELGSMPGIAKTGSIYDVKEGANDNTGSDKVANPKYLIFNCGSSTTVI